MTEQETAAQAGRRAVDELYEWMEWALGIVVCVVLLLTFVIRTVGVFGISMEPTLYEGDGLVTTRLGRAPVYGDIIAIAQPNSHDVPLIKRVIASEGQTIDINFLTGDVMVDGVLLDEPYIKERITPEGQYDLAFPQTVPEGCVFAMGDNRNRSWDSRASEVGMIDNRYVLGRVIFRFTPLSSIGTVA